jgi:uncharacterized ferritin-like protein (DUF455 family)
VADDEDETLRDVVRRLLEARMLDAGLTTEWAAKLAAHAAKDTPEYVDVVADDNVVMIATRSGPGDPPRDLPE